MTKTYLSVVNTAGRDMVHSAAEPFAVVVCQQDTGRIIEVISRHATHHGACVACGHRARRSNRRMQGNAVVNTTRIYAVSVCYDSNGVPCTETVTVEAQNTTEAECKGEIALALRRDGTLAYRVQYMALRAWREQ